MRLLFMLLPLILVGSIRCQAPEMGLGTALSLSRSVTVPLNAVQLHDAATDAWTWSFGKEPGAKILLTDRATGTIKGTARMNFRSTMLTGREETMGTVSYNVTILVQPGECRVTVSDLNHTGNRNTSRGGIHLKQLMRSDEDAYRATGMSRTNIVQLHQELRLAATDHISNLLKVFEARMRSRSEP